MISVSESGSQKSLKSQFLKNVEYKIDHISKTNEWIIFFLKVSEHCESFGTKEEIGYFLSYFSQLLKNFELSRPYIKTKNWKNVFLTSFRTLRNFLEKKNQFGKSVCVSLIGTGPAYQTIKILFRVQSKFYSTIRYL